jgi:hypothetical protein
VEESKKVPIPSFLGIFEIFITEKIIQNDIDNNEECSSGSQMCSGSREVSLRHRTSWFQSQGHRQQPSKASPPLLSTNKQTMLRSHLTIVATFSCLLSGAGAASLARHDLSEVSGE